MLPFITFAQNEKPKSGYLIYYDLDYCSKFIKSGADKQIAQQFRDLERSDWGNSYGLVRLQQLPNPKLSVEFGIGISRRKITTHPVDSIFLDGIFYPDASFVHDYIYEYFSIPLQLNYVFFNRPKLTMTTSFGINWNIVKYTSHNFIFVKGDVSYPTGANTFPFKNDVSIGLGIGLKYKVFKRIHLEIKPNVKQAISSGESHHYFKSYFNTLGIQMGIIILGRK